MPLSQEAPALIRANLEQLRDGRRARLVTIGNLTAAQLDEINVGRSARGYTAIVAEVVFIGRHVYESRIVRDGYSVDDIVDQIESAMDAAAVALTTPHMTPLKTLWLAPTATGTQYATGRFSSVQPGIRGLNSFR